MRYLESPNYQSVFQDGALTVYVKKRLEAPTDANQEWLERVKEMLKHSQTKATEPGTFHGKPAILKVNTLRYLSQKIRAQFGIQRHGRYEWATAELHTALMMQGKAYIPELYAYGWMNNKAGLPTRTFSITQNLVNTVTLEQFSTTHPDAIKPSLTLAFDTLLTALRDRLLHLDPWAGNFLITEDLQRCWLIDLEFSKLNSTATIEQQLGFSFGFFFKGKFSSHMEKSAYLMFVENWARSRVPESDIETLLFQTEYYLENTIKRKKRFSAF